MRKSRVKLSLMAAGIFVLYGCAGSGQQSVSDTACVVNKAKVDLTVDGLKTLYDCTRPTLVAGYQSKDHEMAAIHTARQAASLAPQAPGMHSQQYLMTYVNPVGFAEYIRFATIDPGMPVGSVIAKETFTIKGNKVKHGPLLFMEAVGQDVAQQTGGWRYSGIKPNGSTQQPLEMVFCQRIIVACADVAGKSAKTHGVTP